MPRSIDYVNASLRAMYRANGDKVPDHLEGIESERQEREAQLPRADRTQEDEDEQEQA